jgi:steroid 5-alpha reductase family enzyme
MILCLSGYRMTIIFIVLSYLFCQMCVLWFIYRRLNNPSVVDVSWSIGLMISGLIYLGSIPITPRNMLVGFLLILWALRLAGYLWYTRIHRGHLDKRYTALSEGWTINESLGFFLNFQLQGVLIFLISGLFYWISHFSNPTLTGIDTIAIVIIMAGIAFESLADLQLYRFKMKQKGAICNIGLWYYSRHPNYFFDWLTWLGFTLFALQSEHGYLAIGSLLLLYVIFTRITGPMTERSSVQSRGQKYIDYQHQTSMFFPWFKRESSK